MLRRTLDRYAHHFEKGGRLERLHPLYEMADTILYTPASATAGASHVRDSLDMKRMMWLVVVALAGPPDLSRGLREIARWAAREAERRAIQEVLERVRWNRTRAASLLRISYKTLLSKIAVCGLAPK